MWLINISYLELSMLYQTTNTIIKNKGTNHHQTIFFHLEDAKLLDKIHLFKKITKTILSTVSIQ